MVWPLAIVFSSGSFPKWPTSRHLFRDPDIAHVLSARARGLLFESIMVPMKHLGMGCFQVASSFLGPGPVQNPVLQGSPQDGIIYGNTKVPVLAFESERIPFPPDQEPAQSRTLMILFFGSPREMEGFRLPVEVKIVFPVNHGFPLKRKGRVSSRQAAPELARLLDLLGWLLDLLERLRTLGAVLDLGNLPSLDGIAHQSLLRGHLALLVKCARIGAVVKA